MAHINKYFLFTCFFSILISSNGRAAEDQVKKLRLIPEGNNTELEILYNGNIHFNVLEVNSTRQVIVEADHVLLSPELTKVIDASAGDSPVIQVTPYNTGAREHKAKFVLQLKKNAKISSRQLPGKFVLQIQSSAELNASRSDSQVVKHRKLNSSAPEWVEDGAIRTRAASEDKSNDVAKQLMDTLNAPPEQKVYHGSRVSFEASNADVHDIFRLVGEASGLNVLTTGDVKSTISLSLKDLPWDQLLDIVLQQNQLRASVIGNVVRVSTLEQFNKEQEEKKASIRLGEELDPVIMAIIPLSYAKASVMKTMISDLVVKTGGAAVAAPGAVGAAAAAAQAGSKGSDSLQAFIRGQIEIDDRSNSLVVTNTKEVIERIRRLVKELDVALPQVLIDSKIVIANESFSKSLGVSYGAYSSNSSNTQGTSLSFNGGAVGNGLTSQSATSGAATTSTSTLPSFAVTSPAESSGGTKAGAAMGFQQLIGPNLNLNMALSVAEANGVSKTVGSPRLIVNNKQSASITDGVQIPTVTPGTLSSPATTTYTTAALSLTVTPQITSAGSVLMDVNIHKDAPDAANASAIDTKTLQTQVLVDSGATLVLGGVYQYTGSSNSDGIPGLMNLPIIGPLFRVDSKSTTKEELMVFITPQILDTGSQGITDKM